MLIIPALLSSVVLCQVDDGCGLSFRSVLFPVFIITNICEDF